MARLWSNRTPGVDRQPVPHRDGIARERRGGDERTAGHGGIARDGLKRPSVVVDEPHTGRNDAGPVALAPFDLPADLPLVIGAEQRWTVVAEGRLGGRANQRQPAERLRSAAEDTRRAVEPARRRPIAGARVVLSGVDEPSDAHVPHGLGRQRVRQMAEGDGRHRGVQTQGGFERLRERRLFGVDPELVVHALNQLPARSQLPRELREDLVLLVGPRELRIGARLTVVVAQILVSREEPQPIANRRTAEVRREVTVPGALVAACRLAGAGNGSRTGWLVRPAVCP